MFYNLYTLAKPFQRLRNESRVERRYNTTKINLLQQKIYLQKQGKLQNTLSNDFLVMTYPLIENIQAMQTSQQLLKEIQDKYSLYGFKTQYFRDICTYLIMRALQYEGNNFVDVLEFLIKQLSYQSVTKTFIKNCINILSRNTTFSSILENKDLIMKENLLQNQELKDIMIQVKQQHKYSINQQFDMLFQKLFAPKNENCDEIFIIIFPEKYKYLIDLLSEELEAYNNKRSQGEVTTVAAFQLFQTLIQNHHEKKEICSFIIEIILDLLGINMISQFGKDFIFSLLRFQPLISTILNQVEGNFTDLQNNQTYKYIFEKCSILALNNNSRKNLENIFINLFQNKEFSYCLSDNLAQLGQYQGFKAITSYCKAFRYHKNQDQVTNFDFKIDKDQIFQFCNKKTNQTSQQTRIQAIILLYKKYQENIVIPQKYMVLQNIHILMNQTQREFEINTNIRTREQLLQYPELIDAYSIESLEQLKQHSFLFKYQEFTDVYFDFKKSFSLADIDNQIIDNIFMNIENRIQIINSNITFIIIKQVNGKQIYKQVIEYQDSYYDDHKIDINLNAINNDLRQFINNNIYDVIIIAYNPIKNVEKLKIRHLAFYNKRNSLDNKVQVTLENPQYITSLTLWNTIIVNIYRCVNLINLYSQYGRFRTEDIVHWTKLKRIYTESDYYSPGNCCMIQKLLQKNKLQYIRINEGQNITPNLLMKQNIEDLRHFICYNDYDGNETLNIENVSLDKLVVLHNQYFNQHYIRIQGNSTKRKKLINQLVHQFQSIPTRQSLPGVQNGPQCNGM